MRPRRGRTSWTAGPSKAHWPQVHSASFPLVSAARLEQDCERAETTVGVSAVPDCQVSPFTTRSIASHFSAAQRRSEVRGARLNICFSLRIQSVDATHRSNISATVS